MHLPGHYSLFIIVRYCYSVDNAMSNSYHTLHYTFGDNKYRHDDVRYNNANFNGKTIFEGDKIAF